MTNEQKAHQALSKLDPVKVAKRLQQRRKQSINNVRISELSDKVLSEIEKHLQPKERITIYHVSHMLSRFGVPHFRSYDKNRFNGITFAFVSTGEEKAPVKIYTAFCAKSDTYSRKKGRLEVLDNIQKDLASSQKFTSEKAYNPVILNTEEAFKYLDVMSGNVNKHSIVRASIDWYITKHVNKKSKTVVAKDYTRAEVLKAEKAIVTKAQESLRGIVDLRLVYSHTVPESLGYHVPAAIRRLENPDYLTVRETTKVRLVMADTKRNKQLSTDVAESLKETLSSVTTEVRRYKDDKPNRVNARMFALRKLAKAYL